MSLFSFFRRRTPEAEPVLEAANLIQAFAAGDAASPDQASTALLALLRSYLPPPTSGLPPPGVSLAAIEERPVGIGNFRGDALRDTPAPASLKGGRLDVSARFQLWGADVAAVDAATDALHARLLAARDALWAAGVLRFALTESSLPEHLPPVNAWRKTADYRLLYEFQYVDGDDARSLITQIPVAVNSAHNERLLVTADLARWDNETAPPLTLRGRRTIHGLWALAFIPAATPTSAVALSRTFDGAAGVPLSFPTFDAFLAAISGPEPTTRHAQVTLPTFTDFLALFTAGPAALTLGDWDENAIPDPYTPYSRHFAAPIRLDGPTERLELAIQGDRLDAIAVVYIQASRR